ncbi:MAG: DUF1097 family protein [Treponema sp.]|nr:DUF1097 family protein [Treponema sp.]
MGKFKVIGLLALLVAVIAPLWATLSGLLGLKTGAVALITAGLYVANGIKIENALKITLGFLAGNFWAFFVVKTMMAVGGGINPNLLLFLTLFVYAIVAVFIACYLDKIFDLSAWLAGWAVTLSLLPPNPAEHFTMVLHIAIAMVAGVWLVGVLITSAHKYLLSKQKN